jgi:hypothetical protein
MDRFVVRGAETRAARPTNNERPVHPRPAADAMVPAFRNDADLDDMQEFLAPLLQSVVQDFFQPTQAARLVDDDACVKSAAPEGASISAGAVPVNLLKPTWSRLLAPRTLCGASKRFLRTDSLRWFLESATRMKPLPLEFAGTPTFPTTGMTSNVTKLEFDRHGALFIAATENGVIRLYDNDDLRAASSLVRNATATNSSIVLSSAPEILPVCACLVKGFRC